jgi:Holliday junction DNA helicase RuvA
MGTSYRFIKIYQVLAYAMIFYMIGYLRGTIIYRDLKSAVVDVNGIGYKVFTNSGSLSDKKEVELFTYLAVRENALDLYGFAKKEELEFFELLLTVSGIGPKSAMAILSVASISTLKQAISTDNSSHLTKVSGIGKKNAEKIVLELKDKIGNFIFDGKIESHDSDAIEALKALGYSEKESREALKKATGETTEQKVRAALKNLNK